jgi:hypothetical protein
MSESLCRQAPGRMRWFSDHTSVAKDRYCTITRTVRDVCVGAFNLIVFWSPLTSGGPKSGPEGGWNQFHLVSAGTKDQIRFLPVITS